MLSSTTTFAVVAFTIATTLFLSSTAVVPVSAAVLTVNNWYLPYEGPKALTANVGDTIIFEWDEGHNVYIHPTMNCENLDEIYVGDTSPTSYTFTDALVDVDVNGTEMFFACDIGSGSHCKAGQNLIVTLFPATTSSPTPTPLPECNSICNPVVGDEDVLGSDSNLKNPETVVEYNWNPRVPTCSSNIGSCETESCATLERKLPSFNADLNVCTRHQIGLQEAGCECERSSSSASSPNGIIDLASRTSSSFSSMVVLLVTVLLVVVTGAN